MSNFTYVRWRKDESRRRRAFPALSRDHPAFEAPCVLCNYSLGSDIEGVQILAVGPDDGYNKAKHEAGRWYTAAAVIVHTSCLAKLDDVMLELAANELTHQQEA